MDNVFFQPLGPGGVAAGGERKADVDPASVLDPVRETRMSSTLDFKSRSLYVGVVDTTDTLPTTATPARALGLLFLRPVLLFVAALIILAAGAAPGGYFYLNVVIVLVDVITVGVVLRLLRGEGRTLRDLLGPVRPVDLAWALLMFVILLVAFFIYTFVGNLIAYGGAPPAGSGGVSIPQWVGLVSVIVMPATVAVAEEVAYRGYGQGVLTARWGKWAGLVVMALIFGLQHVALSMTSPQAALSRFIALALVGATFGLLNWWLKRLAPLIIAHWLIDVLFLGLPVLALTMGG